MLKRIKITKLFNTFDYEIVFKPEGITILTGPNGYGKTTILKAIHSLAVKNLFFFTYLLFEYIELEFNDNTHCFLIKKSSEEVEVRDDKKNSFIFNRKTILRLSKKFLDEGEGPFRQINEDTWHDLRSETVITTEMLLQEVLPTLANFPGKEQFEKLNFFNKIPDVYLIREQRLLRRVPKNSRRHPSYYFEIERERGDSFGDTIKEYAKEIGQSITAVLAKASQIGQELDSSFPRRLFDQKEEISEQDFSVRFEKVKEIQKSLNLYGLSIIKEDNHPTYRKENAKALLVYLNDTEEKLKIFSNLIEKLEIFTDILNQRRFIHKKIVVSKEHGLRFLTDQGQQLELTNLSSGEQQEVVILYELLFKAKSGTLVLIDEPEISLHVAWQKEFLNDLFRVRKLQKIDVIVATHSPQIINEHWDLTVDLAEIAK